MLQLFSDLEYYADLLIEEDWIYLSNNMSILSYDFVETFKHELNWELYSFDVDNLPPEEFLIKFEHKIRFSHILYNWCCLYTDLSQKKLWFTPYMYVILENLMNDSNYENFKKTLHKLKSEVDKVFIE